jgi:hypothetical protein
MRTIILLLACLAAHPFRAEASQAPSPVQFHIDTISQVELGHGFQLRLTFQNIGIAPIQLHLPTRADGFPANLRVKLTHGRCEMVLVDATPLHAAAAATTIGPKEVLSVETSPLNINVLYQEIWPHPGEATLRVEYVPAEEGTAGAFPGVLVDERKINFLVPYPDNLTSKREALRACLATGDFNCHAVVAYFAAVRDDLAADILVQLLERFPYLFFVAKAIVAQNRISDVAVLEQTARAATADSRVLLESAAALRRQQSQGCEQPIIKNNHISRRRLSKN